MGAFTRDERGSATVESVIWIPIFVWVLALIINVSMIVFEKNQAYRIVQNANRILSTGNMSSTTQVEEYIQAELASFAPNAQVNTSIENGVVTSRVYYQISDLLLPNVIEQLANIGITISAKHYVEY
ncbi:hypothetical protein ATO6_13965 [Oceanicola sp. 22II-s10i]|nr:hypothetical protein ATO6_13965 [Oceanicola sp. 22II-s10i]